MEPTAIFSCRMCGDCCKGYGGTVVTPEEIEAIAEFIGTDAADFAADFCQMSGKQPVLAQKADGYCIFWDKTCRIHPVKPRMCREWPFIRGVLVDVRNWYAMGSVCPGIRTDIAEADVLACVAEALSRR